MTHEYVTGVGIAKDKKYFLRSDGEIRLFKTEEEAKGFLTAYGYSEKEVQEFQYNNLLGVIVNGEKKYAHLYTT